MKNRKSHSSSIRDRIDKIENKLRKKKSNEYYDQLADKELQDRAKKKEIARLTEVALLDKIETTRIKADQVDDYIDNKHAEELDSLWTVREQMFSTKLCCAKLLSKIRYLKGIDLVQISPFQFIEHESIASLDLDDGEPEILSVTSKVKRFAEVTTRTKQTEFRSIVINAYGVCAISGSRLTKVLEAAHIIPFNGRNDTLKNGILLRSDIHKLFDSFLLSINPKTKELELNPIVESEYGVYKKVILTTGSTDNLSWHYSEFKKLL